MVGLTQFAGIRLPDSCIATYPGKQAGNGSRDAGLEAGRLEIKEGSDGSKEVPHCMQGDARQQDPALVSNPGAEEHDLRHQAVSSNVAHTANVNVSRK
jgi:hypothetical protein